MITLNILFDGLLYPIPVNPDDLTIGQSASNTDIDIIGLGKATRKGTPKLRTLRIKSFFPNPKSPWYNGKTPDAYIEFLMMIWQTENVNNKVAQIYSEGIKDTLGAREINMLFVIEKFDYTYKGGDFDTSYDLQIKEYIPYGTQITNDFSIGMQVARAPSTVKSGSPGFITEIQPTVENKTYTITDKDTLWAIAKEITGNGSNWPQLYELNKEVIGDDPEMLPIGVTIILPENWSNPKSIKNTGTKQKVKVQSSTPGKDDKTVTDEKQKEEAKKNELTQEQQDYLNTARTLHTLQTQYENDISSLNKLADKLSKIDLFGDTTHQVLEISKAKDKLQKMYDNARRASIDPNKTEKERAAAVKEIAQVEIGLASRTWNESNKVYNEIAAKRRMLGWDV